MKILNNGRRSATLQLKDEIVVNRKSVSINCLDDHKWPKWYPLATFWCQQSQAASPQICEKWPVIESSRKECRVKCENKCWVC